MIARVKRSYDAKFVEGDVFQISDVIGGGTEDLRAFCIFAPMQSYREDGSLYCRREGCAHLGDGDWEVIYEEGERG